MAKIRNRIIWLTGATSGIGLSLVDKLSRDNHIVASSRSLSSLKALQHRYPAIDILPVDVSSVSVQTLRSQLEDLVERLDLVICSAGIAEYVDSRKLDIDCFERVFQTNYFGVLRCTTAAQPLIEKGISPQVAVVSSQSVLAPFPRAEAYGSSKAALEYSYEALRYSYNDKNIHLSIIRPGFIETPMTDKNDFPMPFLMNSNEAGKIIVDGLYHRKNIIEFPKRLSWTLKLLSMKPVNLFRLIAPKMARHNQL